MHKAHPHATFAAKPPEVVVNKFVKDCLKVSLSKNKQDGEFAKLQSMMLKVSRGLWSDIIC